MTATPKKKGDTKGLSTACTVNFSRVIRKNYKFGSLLSKLTQYDSIWRGKIVYQTYNYLESIISRVCFSREFFSPFFWVCPMQIVGHTPSLSKRTPWKLGIRIVTTSFIADANESRDEHAVYFWRWLNDALTVLLLPYVRWSVTFGTEGTVFDACYLPFFVLL